MSITGLDVIFVDLAGDRHVGTVVDQRVSPWSFKASFTIRGSWGDWLVPADRIVEVVRR